MIATATIFGLLIAAFLLGVKFLVDLIRQHRPHKIDMPRHWKEGQRSRTSGGTLEK